MGYLTVYTLYASDFSAEVFSEIKKMKVFGEYDFRFFPIESDITMWYSWREDMTILSRKFPEILFTLHARGEDNMWKAYFKSGRAQVCKASITYEPFDESKMEQVLVKRTSYSYQNN